MIEKMQQELEKGGVKFLPWIGNEYEEGIYYNEEGKLCYGNGKGKKVLVLGESFYWDDEDDGNGKMFIHDLIEDFINPVSDFRPYKRTFIKFERAVAGRELDKEERIEFWNHVAFYNYVQEPLTQARTSPTTNQYISSEELLFFLLKKIVPDCFIVWGKRLYNNLPQEGEQGEDVEIKDDYYETWIYKINEKSMPFIGIYHPSVGFDWQYWHNVIKLFFETIDKSK